MQECTSRIKAILSLEKQNKNLEEKEGAITFISQVESRSHGQLNSHPSRADAESQIL